MWSLVEPQPEYPNEPPRMPSPRYAHSTTVIGRQLVVFGGCGPDAALNDLWIFDLETLQWSQPLLDGALNEFWRVVFVALIPQCRGAS